jgi:uncharacterized membrane protein YfcA
MNPRQRVSNRRFARHYIEMVIAMAVGMVLLHPLWMLASRGAAPTGVLRAAEIESLVMATTMAIGMVAWMRYRRHAWRHILEMSAAMYAGFVVLFPALWLQLLAPDDVLSYGHVLMLIFMLVIMLWRREVYVAAHDH